MIIKIKYFFGVLTVMLPFFSLYAVPIIEFSAKNEALPIGKSIYILKDSTNNLSFGEVRSSKDFIHSESLIPNLGISKSTYWLKFKLKNNSNSDYLLLSINQPMIDEIEFYSISASGTITKKHIDQLSPIYLREHKDVSFVFDLNIIRNQGLEIYLKIRSTKPMTVPILIGQPQNIYQKLKRRDTLFGIYSGIIIAMFFYNLFIYFTIKDNTYLYYVLYIILIGLTQISLQGYTFQYVWPEAVWWNQQSIFVLSAMVGIAAMEFIKKFLNTKENALILHKGIGIFNFLFGICIILSLLNYFTLSFQLMQVTTLLGSIYAIIVAYRIHLKGYRPAKFFLMAWSVLLVGACIFVLKDFEFIPYTEAGAYTLQGASAIEVILLSFALADKINILKKEKEDSQLKAFEVLKENEKLIREQNLILEHRVTERTLELQEANEELNVILSDLKDTQSKLVESEKMASLGQLTAGIAHEINNPINFVSSSVTPLRRDIKFVMELLDKYNVVSQDLSIQEKFAEVRKFEKRLDIPYLKEEIDSIINGISDGASRTSEIVRGLKNFSRLDESDLKKADINLGLDSTLILLNNKFDSINLVKNYGKISVVDCYAGKINQVFMNILSNSIHALEHKKTPGKGEIVISTSETEKNIQISIRDNGIGIPEDIRTKIFDPFFTTKEVGEGTGLGLSIVYNIIQSHAGEILVNSKPDEGTEFVISLPKSQKV